MELLTALIIGFAGSFHCIGMCGPIALALPVKGYGRNFIPGRLLYNIGRVISYSLLGAVFGLMGGKIILSGFQQGLSISLGLFILVTLAAPLRYRNILLAVPLVERGIGILKSGLSNQFKKSGMLSLLLIGILNGFLPCGFVYIGLAAAAASATVLKGAAVMIMFGLGTLPVMIAVSTFSRILSMDFRKKISRAVPYFAAILGIIFILRGMNLGVEYLSPKFSKHSTASSLQTSNCCSGVMKKAAH